MLRLFVCLFVCMHMYRIAGFFLRIKFFTNWPFPDFQGGKFSRIVTDCKEYLLKSKHFEGKIFMNWFRFVKFTKIFPLETNPLYGILMLLYAYYQCVYVFV